MRPSPSFRRLAFAVFAGAATWASCSARLKAKYGSRPLCSAGAVAAFAWTPESSKIGLGGLIDTEPQPATQTSRAIAAASSGQSRRWQFMHFPLAQRLQRIPGSSLLSPLERVNEKQGTIASMPYRPVRFLLPVRLRDK